MKSGDIILVILGISTSLFSCSEHAPAEIEEQVAVPVKINEDIIEDKELSYVEVGKDYVMSTQGVLGKNLKGALKESGASYAVEFCNERAYPLVDSMSVVLGAKIKRVSDKPRNSLNTANELELTYIERVKQFLANGEEVMPQVQELEGKMVGYYPIVTNKMCMQCHGEPNVQILPETLEKLNTLYPKDLATGYTENQLRGIWVVELDKK